MAKNNALLEEIDTPSGDLLDEITDDEELPPAWDPDEAGQGIVGVVTARTTMTSKYHEDPIPVVVIQTADEAKHTIYGSRTRTRAEITEKDPQPGDTFAIKYLGEKQRKDGSGSYHHYRAKVRRGEGERPAAGAGKPPF